MTPSGSGPGVIDRRTLASTGRQERAYLPIALVVSVVTWFGLYLQRGASHYPNIDDYFYTALAYRLGNLFVSSPGNGLDAVLHTNTTAPLVPVVAALPSRLGGVQGAVGVEVVFLILLVIGAYLLARHWLGPAASGVTALVVGVNQAALGWSLMLNFALAAATATVWTFVSYLSSDRLQKRGWAVATGVSGGLLLLSRSLALAYALPLAVVIAVDLIWSHRARLSELPWLGIGIATSLVVVLAGPWWAVSGRHALHYLRGTGYQNGVRLSVAAIGRRLYWILYDLGRFQAIALVVSLAVFVVLVATRKPGGGGRLLIGAWAILTIIVLSTSYPGGTGFGLPVIAMVIVLVASALPSSRLIALVVCVLLVAGVTAEATGGLYELWLGPPYRVEALEISEPGNGPVADFDSLEQGVLSIIGGGATVLTRDDDAVNAGGLNWFAAQKHRSLNLVVAPYGGNALRTVGQELRHATFLITGTTTDSYHYLLSQEAVKRIATQEGFVPFRVLRINDVNTVEVWRHVAPNGRGAARAPVVESQRR
jgi:Dolichyl-phosphate-mannose-protein mannosyltransferase